MTELQQLMQALNTVSSDASIFLALYWPLVYFLHSKMLYFLRILADVPTAICRRYRPAVFFQSASLLFRIAASSVKEGTKGSAKPVYLTLNFSRTVGSPVCHRRVYY